MTSTNIAAAFDELIDAVLSDCIAEDRETVVKALFHNDPDAALSVLVSMNGDNRGYWAVKLGMDQLMEPTAYGAFLENAWDHDHQYVQQYAMNFPREDEDGEDCSGSFTNMGEVLKECFEYAAFPIPDDLPETLTVYRGCYGLNRIDTGCGYSWTTSRKTGAWFANRKPFRDIFAVAHYDEDLGPCLVKATIKRSDVMLFTNEREEQEVVTFAVKPWTVKQIEAIAEEEA